MPAPDHPDHPDSQPKRHYLFLTPEGHTYQPHSEATEPDIDNCQVVGWAAGEGAEAAFHALVAAEPYLLGTTFDEVICYALRGREVAGRFWLSEHRRQEEQEEQAGEGGAGRGRSRQGKEEAGERGGRGKRRQGKEEAGERGRGGWEVPSSVAGTGMRRSLISMQRHRMQKT